MEKYSEKRKRGGSGSEDDDRYAMVDEKKRKRMISNRESARRSRMKREQHVKDLNSQLMFLEKNSKETVQKINEVAERFAAVESENRVLRAQKEELGKRLESAEIVSSYVVGTSGGFSNSMDEAQAQDPWFRPWQSPPQSLPITTSDGFFQF